MAFVVRCLEVLLERRGLISWERRSDEGGLLTITNAWPHREYPAYGPFIKRTVDGLEALGVESDVLFVRGYRGVGAYTGAAMLVGVLRVTKRYTIVHAHGGEAGLIARLYTGAPVVTSFLGSDLLAPQEGGWRLALRRRVRSAVLRQHARLMTATTTKTREMEAVLPRRVRDRNAVIPDGISLDDFKPIDRDVARAHLKWDPGARIVVFVGGRDCAIKRPWLAEQAAALARAELNDLELVVVSGVDPDEMPYYYSAADCLLHTSASEGSPNVIKEALACNLPIVATPAGDIERLVAGVQPGSVVEADPGALARDVVSCCREPVRSNGRTVTDEMSLHTAASATLDLYRSLADCFPIPTQPPIWEAPRLPPALADGVLTE